MFEYLIVFLKRALSPNQKTVILRTAIENGGKAEWDFAFDQYKSKVVELHLGYILKKLIHTNFEG